MFSIVKVLAHFRSYILSVVVEAYVPYPPIKMMLNEPLREERWVNWIAKL